MRFPTFMVRIRLFKLLALGVPTPVLQRWTKSEMY